MSYLSYADDDPAPGYGAMIKDGQKRFEESNGLVMIYNGIEGKGLFLNPKDKTATISTLVNAHADDPSFSVANIEKMAEPGKHPVVSLGKKQFAGREADGIQYSVGGVTRVVWRDAATHRPIQIENNLPPIHGQPRAISSTATWCLILRWTMGFSPSSRRRDTKSSKAGVLSFGARSSRQHLRRPSRRREDPDARTWWERAPGWAKEVNGLRVRIDLRGVNTRRGGNGTCQLMFWNVSERTFALNPSDVTMDSWEVRDAKGKVVEPSETKPAAAKAYWYPYNPGQSSPGQIVSFSDVNRGGRLELAGRVWQLAPGRYTLRVTFSGPSKAPGKPEHPPAWEGRVEVPEQAFEVYGEPTPEEFKAAIAKARAQHADNAQAKWRALAELVTPGMDVAQLHEALPPAAAKDGSLGWIGWNGNAWSVRYSVDDNYEVEAEGIGEIKAHPIVGGLPPETEMILESRPQVKAAKEAGITIQPATQPPATQPAPTAADQQKAIAEIQASGGIVETDDKAPGKPVILVWFPNVKITDAGLAPVAALTQLQTLNLWGDGVSDAGLVYLPKLTQLRRVNLPYARVTDAGLVNLEGLSQLEVLDLSDTNITDAGLVHLKGLTKLQWLMLFGTKITGSGLAQLKDLPHLQRLELMDTGITDATLQHLEGMTQLQGLTLSQTKITDAGLVHLQGFIQLHMLDLIGLQIDDGLKNLEHMSQLDELYLGHTLVSDAGLSHLSGLTKLERLDLSSTKITDAGLAKLEGLTSLGQLYLGKTHVTAAGVAALQKALPKCSISH